jgi:hypothetical protein
MSDPYDITEILLNYMSDPYDITEILLNLTEVVVIA